MIWRLRSGSIAVQKLGRWSKKGSIWLFCPHYGAIRDVWAYKWSTGPNNSKISGIGRMGIIDDWCQVELIWSILAGSLVQPVEDGGELCAHLAQFPPDKEGECQRTAGLDD